MSKAFIDYLRCPADFADFTVAGDQSDASGYFQFGDGVTCFGRLSGGSLSTKPEGRLLYDALSDVTTKGSSVRLPFDLTQVVDNLRFERYVSERFIHSLIRDSYYLLRSLVPPAIRRHAQRIYVGGGHEIPFPRWPVDLTVEQMMERLLRVSMTAKGVNRIPFIWFWPDGAQSCAIITHDVETLTGRDYCTALMDIDDSFGMKASFEIVPEARYPVSADYLDSIRSRGFEINVHDLNHDGQLFRDRQEFLRRAAKINRYAKEFGAGGFRSGGLYRNTNWYDAFEFSYDMSLPNVAHLDPQRGGCCTVMPFFIGNVLELPLTTTQDYSLFHILRDYSIELWKRQTELIMERHGLMSFIIHPDYVIDQKAQNIYKELLAYLSGLRAERNVWAALPGEVNTWWRQRSQMQLAPEGRGWRIEGQGRERARIAYANLCDGRLVYELEEDGVTSVLTRPESRTAGREMVGRR